MTPAPHPLDCGTCNYNETKNLKDFVNCSERKEVVRYNDHCASHSSASSDVLDEKKTFLGKIAIRIRQEFCQDDDEEYYLSSYDFENVLEEMNQEIEDEEELRQQTKEHP
jgi:hypothetical protein